MRQLAEADETKIKSMNENERGKLGARKSLYIFLTAILGIVLFLTLQRALTLLYFVIVSYNYAGINTELTFLQYEAINFVTLLLAIFFGGWYGVWLGLHWYEIVYEKNAGHRWFGLSGKLFDHSQNIIQKTERPTPRPAPAVFKPTPAASPAEPDTKTYKLTDLKKEDPDWLNSLQKSSSPSVAVASKSKNGSKARSARKPAVKTVKKTASPKVNNS